MRIPSRQRGHVLAWTAMSILLLPPAVVHADDAFTLAASKTQKLQVFADGGAAWCGENLRLRMVLEPDSPNAQNMPALVGIMNRLKAPIVAECKTARRAELTVIHQSKAVAIYKASASDGWMFLSTPATQATEAPKAAPAIVAAPPSEMAQRHVATPSPQVGAPATAIAPALRAEIGKDYAGLLVRFLRDNAALAQEEGTMRWWAGYRFPNEYRQFAGQEFKLQPVLAKARADLADTIQRTDPDRITIRFDTYFDAYDFASQRFPVKVDRETLRISRSWCCVQSNTPDSFTITIAGLDGIAGMPMDNAAAQRFVERQTRFGSVDRSITIVATARIDPAGIKKNERGQMVIGAELESAEFYAGRGNGEAISRLDETTVTRLRTEKELAKAAAAEAERKRQVEIARQQLLAQRERNISSFASYPLGVRLANFVSPRPLNSGIRLDNLRTARAAALIKGQAVDVIMLVQTASSGKVKVMTKWPGKLQVSVPDKTEGLKSSGWYLVLGTLSVPEEDGLPVANLFATDVYACLKEQCAEAADPTAIVDRKLAAMGAAPQGMTR